MYYVLYIIFCLKEYVFFLSQTAAYKSHDNNIYK